MFIKDTCALLKNALPLMFWSVFCQEISEYFKMRVIIWHCSIEFNVNDFKSISVSQVVTEYSQAQNIIFLLLQVGNFHFVVAKGLQCAQIVCNVSSKFKVEVPLTHIGIDPLCCSSYFHHSHQGKEFVRVTTKYVGEGFPQQCNQFGL